MKTCKYITTDKHPELKEGIQFKTSGSRKDMLVSYKNQTVYIAKFDIDELIEDNFLKELQEPEFTRDDMLWFARWYSSTEFDESGVDIVNEWKENNK